MKKKLLIIPLIVFLIACKEKNNLAPETGIVGKWRLISYCQPSGGLASGCIPKTVPNDKAVFVEFSDNGKFEETYQNTIPAEYSFLGCGAGGYKIENGDVRIKAICMSSLEGKLVEINSITNKKLILKTYFVGEYIFEKE
ncbi:MAG: lipocalin family protein [Bacteroidota bacterium]